MQVHYGRKTRKSGRVLAQALRGIEGPSVNFGYQRTGSVNPSHAVKLASNKCEALEVLGYAGVPTPELYDLDHVVFPCVARPDKHRAGQSFWLCESEQELADAFEQGASHFMEYVQGGREFRVHVAFGKSIKIAEKIGGDPVVKNFEKGSKFMYPKDFNHKKTLRKLAKRAVMSLGLDFGAVDMIYKDKKWYVLEVNTAPSLTSQSDVLERYVKAFKELQDG